MTIKTGFIVAVIASLFALGAIVMLIDENSELKSKNEALIVQNVQLTKSVREAKVRGFRDGLDKCANEDIEYFNEMAVEIPQLAKLMDSWAENWAYDDDTTNQMVEDYMDEGTD